MVLAIVLAAGMVHAESGILDPERLSKDLLTNLPGAEKQEFMEVSAPAYPGLTMSPLSLQKLITPPGQLRLIPSRDPKYYQNGGMILARWGFPMPASQIFSTTVP